MATRQLFFEGLVSSDVSRNTTHAVGFAARIVEWEQNGDVVSRFIVEENSFGDLYRVPGVEYGLIIGLGGWRIASFSARATPVNVFSIAVQECGQSLEMCG